MSTEQAVKAGVGLLMWVGALAATVWLIWP